MKNANEKRSLGDSKAQKESASKGREAAPTDPPNSGGHQEK